MLSARCRDFGGGSASCPRWSEEAETNGVLPRFEINEVIMNTLTLYASFCLWTEDKFDPWMLVQRVEPALYYAISKLAKFFGEPPPIPYNSFGATIQLDIVC